MSARLPGWLRRLQYQPKRRQSVIVDPAAPAHVRARDRLMAARAGLLEDAAGPPRGARARGVFVMLAGVLAIGSMVHLVSAQVLAVNFTTTSSKFRVYTNYLEAREVAGYLAPGTKSASNEAVLEMGIKRLNLVGLCVLATEDIGGVIPASIMITAGMPVADPVANWDSGDVNGSANDAFDTDALFSSASFPVASKLNAAGQVLNAADDPDVVSAEYGYLNSTLLTAFGHQVQGLVLGETADTVNAHAGIGDWPGGGLPGGANPPAPTAGDFGIYGKQMNLSGFGGNTFGLNLKGSITLPRMKIRVVPGTKTQADCA